MDSFWGPIAIHSRSQSPWGLQGSSKEKKNGFSNFQHSSSYANPLTSVRKYVMEKGVAEQGALSRPKNSALPISLLGSGGTIQTYKP